MAQDDTLRILMAFLAEEAKVPPGDPDFTPEVDLFDFGYVDSFGLVRLIEWVKERFGVDLGNADFYADLRAAARIARFIDERRPA